MIFGRARILARLRRPRKHGSTVPAALATRPRTASARTARSVLVA